MKIDSPYLLGIHEAYCFNTDYNLIIGNMPGAKCWCLELNTQNYINNFTKLTEVELLQNITLYLEQRMAAEKNQNLNKIKPTNDCENKSTKLNQVIGVNLSYEVYNKEITNTDAISCNNIPYDKKIYEKKRKNAQNNANNCKKLTETEIELPPNIALYLTQRVAED